MDLLKYTENQFLQCTAVVRLGVYDKNFASFFICLIFINPPNYHIPSDSINAGSIALQKLHSSFTWLAILLWNPSVMEIYKWHSYDNKLTTSCKNYRFVEWIWLPVSTYLCWSLRCYVLIIFVKYLFFECCVFFKSPICLS